ncbi:MAG: Ldh family oxidoreductase [Rhizobiaceae bacterium]|nr:Ldh family oxidoreductase [Rhizobiaceae bacterium]
MLEGALPRFDSQKIRNLVGNIFEAAGVEAEKAAVMAECLTEADMIGHFTHGLALVPGYVAALADGVINGKGDVRIISDRGACVAWDGNQLPGAWLTASAVDLAVERASQYGTCSVAVGRSQHNGALAAYLRRATDKGFMVQICCSTASGAWVAPFGGTKRLFTPNPMAAGIPTEGDPILLDISASITTVTMVNGLAAEGKKFDHDWLLTAGGIATNDPVEVTQNGGSLMPLGGMEKGHKGYAMALLVEALSHGLSGFGRMGEVEEGSLSVFVTVSDPDAFGGADSFRKQMSFLADACRDNPPRPGVEAVRVPGDAAMAKWRDAQINGVVLSAEIADGLEKSATQFGLAMV